MRSKHYRAIWFQEETSGLDHHFCTLETNLEKINDNRHDAAIERLREANKFAGKQRQSEILGDKCLKKSENVLSTFVGESMKYFHYAYVGGGYKGRMLGRRPELKKIPIKQQIAVYFAVPFREFSNYSIKSLQDKAGKFLSKTKNLEFLYLIELEVALQELYRVFPVEVEGVLKGKLELRSVRYSD